MADIIELDAVMNDRALDRIVAEQAAYYGMTVERFTRFSRTMAELQERAEYEGWDGMT